MRRLIFSFAALFLMLATTLFPTTLNGGEAGNSYLGYWDVELVSVVYDEDANSTTFTYTVESICRGGKDLSHWVLGIEEGAVVESATVEGVNYSFSGSGLSTDPTTGLFGFKFDDGQPMCTTYTYTITLFGQWCGVEAGEFALKAGSNQVPESVAFGEVETPGDCDGNGEEDDTFTISGTAFIDVNGNALFDPAEPVLADVPILIDGDHTVFTDAQGEYIYGGLIAGTYTISVDISSEDGIAPLLSEYFVAVTPLSVDVTVGPSVEHIDFGFALKIDDETVLSGEGKTIGFWKHQLSVIISGKGRAQVSPFVINELISSINSFFIPDPFIISSYSDAFNILSSRSSDPVKLMLKQLLAAEFNKFYGIGLSNPVLMTLILQTAESYAFYSSDISYESMHEMQALLDRMNNLGEEESMISPLKIQPVIRRIIIK